ncbi:hypothetical protein [Scandinavium sp.]|uniref:hypothetical protein n=1 Tax=Scandinavium sp. TaxID=2830653 RepID=UPI0028A2ADEC|nr:hypothetical protein [Scandinavium sp.]
MTTYPDPDHDLLTIPFSATTDFTDLADYCDRFALALMESNDVPYQTALLDRLGACLTLLRPTLGEPIPDHLLSRFVVDTLPESKTEFEPDAEALCDYCQSLTQLLSNQTLSPETEKTLKGLLCELVWMFAADLKAPRWLRTKLV